VPGGLHARAFFVYRILFRKRTPDPYPKRHASDHDISPVDYRCQQHPRHSRGWLSVRVYVSVDVDLLLSEEAYTNTSRPGPEPLT